MADSVDPRSLITDDQRALAVLAALNPEDRWRTASQISDALRDEHGIRLHWRTIAHLFENNRDFVARRKRSGSWTYSIMQQGRERLTKRAESITLIDPGKAVSAV